MANVYDPKQVTLVLAYNVIEGWAEDQFIETNFNEPERFNFQNGATGEVFISANPNQTGYLKLFLKQSSVSNDLLSNLLQTRRVFTWLLTDASSNTTVAASAASLVQTVPALVRARQQQEYEWQIYCIKYVLSIGGIPSIV